MAAITPGDGAQAAAAPDAPQPRELTALSPAEVEQLHDLAERASAAGFVAKKRDDAIAVLRRLERATTHLGVATTNLVAHVDTSRRGQRGSTTSQIITETRRISTKLADRAVKRARRLARYPEVLSALAAGHISEPNADTICLTADEIWPFLTEAQQGPILAQLIEEGRGFIPSAVKDRCREIKDSIDLQGARTRAEQDEKLKELSHRKRFLVFDGDPVRGYDIRGHLPGIYAEVVRRALARESNIILRMRRRKREPVPGEATRELDALVRLARKSEKQPPPDDGPSGPGGPGPGGSGPGGSDPHGNDPHPGYPDASEPDLFAAADDTFTADGSDPYEAFPAEDYGFDDDVFYDDALADGHDVSAIAAPAFSLDGHDPPRRPVDDNGQRERPLCHPRGSPPQHRRVLRRPNALRCHGSRRKRRHRHPQPR